MQNLTNAELEQAIIRASHMSQAGVHSKAWREYDAAGQERVVGQTKLLEACVEAARRGILRDIQVRRPDLRLPHYAPNQDLLQLLATQRGWVANRGFLHDHNLATALEELVAFRRVLQRAELTGEDEVREYTRFLQLMKREEDRIQFLRSGHIRGAFLAGLRRGFELRGEERQSTSTNTTAN